jgi:SpoIID/LytB domain protein
VLILESAQKVAINFLSEFEADLARSKINFHKGDSLIFSVLNGILQIQSGNEFNISKSGKIVIKGLNENQLIKIKNVPYGVGWWWEAKEDRFYNCDLELVINKNNLIDVIAVLPIEKYLEGVVPNEIGSDAPFEALKAQVISARTETMHALIYRKYSGENYDICSDVDCQVYGGINKKNAITDSAIKITEGLFLTFNDEIIPAYFGSNCGGMSESIEKVWQHRSPAVDYYLPRFDSDINLSFNPNQNPEEWIKSSPDVFCNPEYHPQLPEWSRKNFRWKVEIAKEVLNTNLNKIKHIGDLKKIEIIERGYSGRIIKMKFIGETDSLLLDSELSIRKVINPPLRSSNFIFENYSAKDIEIPDTLILRGAGWGHGVGLCQSGAVGRALSGQNFEKILFHYYPNTKIKKIY